MLEATDSFTETVYVRLLDEGTTVLRPTKAVHIEDLVYRILPTEDYDSQTELWQFPPGSIVECAWENKGDIRALVAQRKI
jgi:hypothetical protein